MKKLFALILATLMVLGCAAVASAEQAQTMELNWEDFEAEIESSEEMKAAWSGDFVTMEEIALKLYIPASFEQTELTDEDREAGYIAYFTMGENAGIGIQYVDMSGMSLEEYAQVLTEEYGYECTDAVVNGLPALGYSFTEDDRETAVLAFATEKGYILEISFAPTNDEGFSAVATVLMASVQAADQADEQAAE